MIDTQGKIHPTLDSYFDRNIIILCNYGWVNKLDFNFTTILSTNCTFVSKKTNPEAKYCLYTDCNLGFGLRNVKTRTPRHTLTAKVAAPVS